MNIIFGRDQVALLQDKYTILELDTFNIDNKQEITAYCVVENISIMDMPGVENMKSLHANLLENYRKCDWNFCEQALEHLTGCWNNELDTFYNSIRSRINEYKDKELTNNWWLIDRTVIG
jgi:hypothetical protein